MVRASSLGQREKDQGFPEKNKMKADYLLKIKPAPLSLGSSSGRGPGSSEAEHYL